MVPLSPHQRADSCPGDSAQEPVRRTAATQGRSTSVAKSLQATVCGGRPRLTASNSQSQYVSVSPMPEGIRIQGIGIDTCSLAWRPDDLDVIWKYLAVGEELGTLLGSEEAIALALSRIQRRGGWFYEVCEPVAGARWFWWRKHRTIVCEGRLARIAGEVEDESDAPARLGSLQDLRTAAAVAPYFFEHLTWPSRLPVGGARLRRLDLAVDLAFPPAAGLAFLALASCINVPGLQRTVWFGESQPQTIYFRRGKVIKFRIYDKGVQMGSAPAGTHIRVERQIRWPKRDQPKPEDITAADLDRLWTGELKAWAEAGRSASVLLPPEAQGAIATAATKAALLRSPPRSSSGTLA
jgi:hypothetical protein